MVFCTTMDSPAGRLTLAGDRDGTLTHVHFGDAPPGAPWTPSPAPFAEAVRQLALYFAGRLREFNLPLAPQGTPFQLAVWEELRRIPYGATNTYGELARRLGQPGAARAVGLANGANPIAIIIPCHRVIGASGHLTGYAGGLDIKRRLLDLEAGVPLLPLP